MACGIVAVAEGVVCKDKEHIWSKILFCFVCFFFLMMRRPPRSTQSGSSAASDVYNRQRTSRCALRSIDLSTRVTNATSVPTL